MSTRTLRRQANKGKTISNVQVGANRIFKAPGKVDLLPAVRNAVELNQAIIVEGQLLATLHVLRLLRNNRRDLIPRLGTGTNQSQWQTMMCNCYAAVSHATGTRCQVQLGQGVRNSLLATTQTWQRPTSCTSSLCQLDTSNQSDQHGSNM